jgi:hypothetical protein
VSRFNVPHHNLAAGVGYLPRRFLRFSEFLTE